jgi:hypothetical protein
VTDSLRGWYTHAQEDTPEYLKDEPAPEPARPAPAQPAQPATARPAVAQEMDEFGLPARA